MLIAAAPLALSTWLRSNAVCGFFLVFSLVAFPGNFLPVQISANIQGIRKETCVFTFTTQLRPYEGQLAQ